VYEIGDVGDAPNSIEKLAVKLSFVGANARFDVIGEDTSDYDCNFFIGNDQSKWHADVPNYQAVVFTDVYPGIDLKYRSASDGNPE
jgi:hypothetical protein